MSPGSSPSSTTIWFTDAFPNFTGTRSATLSPGRARNTVVVDSEGRTQGAIVADAETSDGPLSGPDTAALDAVQGGHP